MMGGDKNTYTLCPQFISLKGRKPSPFLLFCVMNELTQEKNDANSRLINA